MLSLLKNQLLKKQQNLFSPKKQNAVTFQKTSGVLKQEVHEEIEQAHTEQEDGKKREVNKLLF